MLIRPATVDDWPAIWPIFSTIVAAGETYAYPEDLTSDEARALWLEPPPGSAFVAVGDDGTVLGSAKTGPNRPGRGAHVSTASFMVSPEARGQGVGRALAEHVLAWATEQGYRSMQFNAVVETNTSAVRLWQDLGFTVVGTVPEAFDHRTLGLVGLHVMYRELQPRRPRSDSVSRPATIITRWLAAGDAGDWAAFDLLLHPDVVVHAPGGLSTASLEEEKAVWQQARAAARDLRHDVQEVVADGEVEMARVVVTGALVADFAGVEGLGQPFRIDQAVIVHLRDGLVSEAWEIADLTAVTGARASGAEPGDDSSRGVGEDDQGVGTTEVGHG